MKNVHRQVIDKHGSAASEVTNRKEVLERSLEAEAVTQGVLCA